MSVIRCQYCRTPIEWLATTFKRRLPFEHELVDLDQLGDQEGWVIVRKDGRRLCAAPLDQVGPRTASGVRRALVIHTCEGYLKAKAERESAKQASTVPA